MTPVPKRRAVLHIGTAKTGSTSIQSLLADNRARLGNAGFLVPTSPGERNHFRLAIFAGGARADRMAKATGEAGTAADVAARFAPEFHSEMQAMPPGIHTVLFSNEHCYRKLDTPHAITKLRDLLAPWFDEFEVLVYLRRQDEMAVSLYSTRLRSGDDREDVLPDLAALPNQAAKLDWHALVERWAAVFGRGAMRPRRFGRDAFTGGDLLTDYMTAVGIDGVAGLKRPTARNGAIQPAAQEFLRRVNTALAEEGGDELDDKAPPFLRSFVDQFFSGRGRRPSRAQAEAFMARFDASNERLRAAWFPDRATLYDADYTRYPDVADKLPSDSEVLDVALAFVGHQALERPAQEAEAAYQRAVKLHAGRALEEAVGFLNKALGKQPGHLPSLRLLFEIARTPTLRRDAEARLRRARKEAPDRDDLARLQAEQGVAYDPTPLVRPKRAVNGVVAVAEPATDSPRDRQRARQEQRRLARAAAPVEAG